MNIKSLFKIGQEQAEEEILFYSKRLILYKVCIITWFVDEQPRLLNVTPTRKFNCDEQIRRKILSSWLVLYILQMFSTKQPVELQLKLDAKIVRWTC